MGNIKTNELYAQWNKGVVKPVYVFAGEELYLQEEAWRYIEKKLGVDSFNVELFYIPESDTDQILLAAQTLPFLTEKRLVIVKDAHKLRKGDEDKIAEFLKRPPESACMILLWPEKVRKDKRSALFAATEKAGDVVDFHAMYENQLPVWVQEKTKACGKSITNDAVQSLIQESGSSLLDLSNELEKLDLYTGKRKEINRDDVEELSGHTRLANLNALSEAIEARQEEKALQITEQLLEEGEIPLKILATVYRVYRRLLAARAMEVESGYSQLEVRQELHLNTWFDKNFFVNVAKYKLPELEKGLEAILYADRDLKSSSRTEQAIFEELLLTLFGSRRDKL